MPTVREQFRDLDARSADPSKVDRELVQSEAGENVGAAKRLSNPFEQARLAAAAREQTAREQGEGSGQHPPKATVVAVNTKQEWSKSAKNKAPDANQRSITSFLSAGAGKAAKEAPQDPVPATCDDWDKAWEAGIEGLQIKRRQKDDVMVEKSLTSGNDGEGAKLRITSGPHSECRTTRQVIAASTPDHVDDPEDGWVTVATSEVPKPGRADCGKPSRNQDADDSAIARDLQLQEYRKGAKSPVHYQGQNNPRDGAREAALGACASRSEGSAFQALARLEANAPAPHDSPSAGGPGEKRGRPCRYGVKCYNADCRFWHPAPHLRPVFAGAMGKREGVDGGQAHEGRSGGGGGSSARRLGPLAVNSVGCMGAVRSESEELDRLPGKVGPEYRDAWDKRHVRLPCSPECVGKDMTSRWLKIRRALSPAGGFRDVASLVRAITSYMARPREAPGRWTFRALESLVNDYFRSSERAAFFDKTLPYIIEAALALPVRCSRPIPLLRAGQSGAVNLSSLQIVSLLANCFLCTFPEDNRNQGERKFPRCNFYMLFEAPAKPWAPGFDTVNQNTQKLLCILHYFQRQLARSDAELARSLVTFQRRSLREPKDWTRSRARIGDIQVQALASGRIEDHDPTGSETWEADFANCYIGGGVLGAGCVQEEIRFLLSPELIASLLVTERMEDRESVLITGAERFSNYKGYASTFEFDGDHNDVAANDVAGVTVESTDPLSSVEFRRRTTITAMDALYYGSRQYTQQFSSDRIRRELDKARVAFQQRSEAGDGGDLSGVFAHPAKWIATGNWGCGAFGGDHVLKAIIQIVAAAETGRSLKYFTFGDDKLSETIDELYGVLCDGDEGEGCTVAQVWRALQQFKLIGDKQVAAPWGGYQLRTFLLEYRWRMGCPADEMVSEEEARALSASEEEHARHTSNGDSDFRRKRDRSVSAGSAPEKLSPVEAVALADKETVKKKREELLDESQVAAIVPDRKEDAMLSAVRMVRQGDAMEGDAIELDA